MILDVLAYRNKNMKAYCNPFYTQDKLENLEVNMSRTLILGGKDMITKYKNLVLYHFGTFDDQTMYIYLFHHSIQ